MTDLDNAIRLSRAGHSRDGIRIAAAVAQRARENGDSRQYRRALNTVAICQAARGRFIEAVSNGLDVYALSHAAADRIEECHALATLAASAGMILDTDEAGYPVLQYCLELALELGDSALEARARSLLGIRLGTMQRFDEAEHEIHAALKLADAGGPLTPRSLLTLNLAVLAVKRLRAAPETAHSTLAAAARAHTMETMAIAQGEGNAALVARAHYNFGDIDRLTGNAAGALAQFDQSLVIEENLRSPTFLSHLLMARSEVLLELQRWDDAMQASLRAFEHAMQHRPGRDAATAADNLARLCERQGDSEQARQWLQRAQQDREDFSRESQLVREKLIELWSQRSRWSAAA